MYAPSASGPSWTPGSRRRLAALALGVLAAGWAVPPAAQQDPGRFVVREADAVERSGVYYLNALIDFDLSSDARDALHSGLPIVIRIEVEIIHPRRFWIDSEQSLTQRYRLEYHALTERYLVVNVNSGDEASFSSLTSALGSVGRIERLPVIDAPLLEEGRRYDIRLRAVLDTDELPGPLRLLAFWRRDWSIASDWYRWRLQDD